MPSKVQRSQDAVDVCYDHLPKGCGYWMKKPAFDQPFSHRRRLVFRSEKGDNRIMWTTKEEMARARLEGVPKDEATLMGTSTSTTDLYAALVQQYQQPQQQQAFQWGQNAGIWGELANIREDNE